MCETQRYKSVSSNLSKCNLALLFITLLDLVLEIITLALTELQIVYLPCH